MYIKCCSSRDYKAGEKNYEMINVAKLCVEHPGINFWYRSDSKIHVNHNEINIYISFHNKNKFIRWYIFNIRIYVKLIVTCWPLSINLIKVRKFYLTQQTLLSYENSCFISDAQLIRHKVGVADNFTVILNPMEIRTFQVTLT